MKADLLDRLSIAPRDERAILDQIRNDRELIDRLEITPQELDALSKCALLGTLTCKQDMLFILRQIRDVGPDAIDHAALVPLADALPEAEEDSVPNLDHIKARIALPVDHDPRLLETTVRRRVPAQFGVTFWSMVLVAGLVWNAIIAISRGNTNFIAPVGASSAAPVATPDAWYSHLDRPNVLLWWEIFFVGCVAVAMFIKSRQGTRHLKVKPGRSR